MTVDTSPVGHQMLNIMDGKCLGSLFYSCLSPIWYI